MAAVGPARATASAAQNIGNNIKYGDNDSRYSADNRHDHAGNGGDDGVDTPTNRRNY